MISEKNHVANHQQFEADFSVEITVIIISPNLVASFVLSLFFAFVESKIKIRFSVGCMMTRTI